MSAQQKSAIARSTGGTLGLDASGNWNGELQIAFAIGRRDGAPGDRSRTPVPADCAGSAEPETGSHGVSSW